jgi:hypothetical protein
VDGLRALLLAGAPTPAVGVATDFAVLAGTLFLLVVLSARIYPNIAR